MSNESKFDVFLCHNSQDKSIVRAVADALKAVGIKYWLDEGELTPGKLWKSNITEEISKIKSAAIFIGEQGFGPYQEKELQEFLQQTFRDCRLIPVLVPNLSDPGKPPDFLTGNNLWQELSERTYVVLEESNGISRLIWGITGKQPELDEARLAQLHYEKGLENLEARLLPEEIGRLSSRAISFWTVCKRWV